MRSNIYILVFTLLVVLFKTTAASAEQLSHDALAASDKYRLVWNDDPTSTMTIIWDQLKGKDGVVYYGKEDHGREYAKYPNKQPTTRKSLRYHEMNNCYVELSKLEPDQRYYFVIKDDYGVSKRFYFITAPAVPKSFTFISGGDTKSTGSPLEAGRASNRMVPKLRPLFIQFNGDFNSGDGMNPDYWKQWLSDWATMTVTEDGRMFPLIPVHGNHENGDRSMLNKIFNAPYQKNNDTRIYYSLSFGGDFFHIISLNTEIDTGGPQERWLESDLQNHADFTFKIAGYHKPIFPHTQKKPENKKQYNRWAHLFYQYGLDISMDGDSHMHKITYPLKPTGSDDIVNGFVPDYENGTIYMGEGSWGAGPRPNNDIKPWTLESASLNQFKWIHVHPEKDQSPANMEIFTVVTAEYGENRKLNTYVDEVESLSEENLFKIPDNIRLFSGDESRRSVKYPFHLNN